MRNRMGQVGLVAVGWVLGALLHPLLTPSAWANGQDRVDQEPAAPARAAPESPDAVEYNLFIPPAYPKADRIVAKLDELGTRGWRLVGTTTANGGTSAFIFMRPRQ
ncbi:MAG: hypothetical protein HY904_19165 [Deltaproteobacteria bacterium]|nr:hypothetical protein [Deltaproteobacteria bacterium]